MAVCIAVVDDDPSVRKGLSRLLRSEGYEALSFASAEECLASPRLPAAGCFLLDIHLGGMSGPELAVALRRAGWTAPVVFITAHDEEATRAALWAVGEAVCLRKPVDSGVMFAAIQRALSGGREE